MKRKASTEFEARALRELMDGREKKAFARQHKLPGGESMLSQHMHERRPVNMEAAVIYAEAFGVTLDRISPTWAALARRASLLLQPVTMDGHSLTVQVQEPAPVVYGIPWPFDQLTPDEWRDLTPDQRSLIEGTAKQFAAQRPNGNRRAAA